METTYLINRCRLTCLFTILTFLLPAPVFAAVYTLKGNDTVIGQLSSKDIENDDTLLDIAKENDFGFQDIKLVNPDVDTWLPGIGTKVNLPGQFILPNVPQVGIVLNIPEMRLYYFPENKKGQPRQVYTFPLGVGREGWSTPYAKTRIISKREHPTWTPPKSIKEEHAANGDPLPDVVKAGPDNPLGDYALNLGLKGYLIHGTNKPFGVGMRVSHGCIRLYDNDIEQLFNMVKIGTPVNIINQPYKVGELDGVIYLEVHPHLDEDNEHFSQNSLTEVVKHVIQITPENNYEIDWDKVKTVVAESKGIPVAIGMHLPEMQSTTAKNSVTPATTSPASDAVHD